jgi:hypothetical protein
MKQLVRNAASRWSLAVGAVVVCGWLAATSLTSPAEAEVGGYSQVTRLEVKIQADNGSAEARFHLASGIALTEHFGGGPAIDRLMQTAQAFSQERVRLFATVEDDKVVSWTLSIP